MTGFEDGVTYVECDDDQLDTYRAAIGIAERCLTPGLELRSARSGTRFRIRGITKTPFFAVEVQNMDDAEKYGPNFGNFGLCLEVAAGHFPGFFPTDMIATLKASHRRYMHEQYGLGKSVVPFTPKTTQ